MDGKYKSQKLHFKVPNVLIVFSNGKPDQNTLSKDKWTILKISNDLRELTERWTKHLLNMEWKLVRGKAKFL